MFLFNISKCKRFKDVLILYTGDYRYQPIKHNDNKYLSNIILDRLYYDDTFDIIDFKLPSFEQTRNTLIEIVSNIPESQPIYINVAILGFEFILRNIAKSLNIKFTLSTSILNTYRGKQLKLLLDGFICNRSKQKCKYILFNRNIEKPTSSNVIYPTSTKFLCEHQQNNKLFEIKNNIIYIWFATHSNRHENKLFHQLTTPRQINPCKDDIGKIKCKK
jgi:hypothetical protein